MNQRTPPLAELHIIRRLLHALSETVAAREFDNHMKRYSRAVSVYGIPGRDVLRYDDIARRRRNEIENGLLRNIFFGEPQILFRQGGAIAYKVRETMEGSNGAVLTLDKEVTLIREGDGEWRIREERITSAQRRSSEETQPLL